MKESEKNSSKNLIRNPGFEQSIAEGRPDIWGVSVSEYLQPHEKSVGLETNAPYEGKFCLKIPKTRLSDPETRAGQLILAGLKTDTTYTLSAYMRANKKGAKAKFHFINWKKAPKILLDKEWKRYSFTIKTGPKKMSLAYAFIWNIGKPGETVYVDAVQLEEGTETTDYEDSNKE
jgi:hypothetical protein